ncbi:MAG: hypothetical protein HYR88_04545 [Verrucomicrobia bacterium]|nr:hypothetical protein [Verrucomicrobiota bacterium]MBI3866967.1 hypothetical protein [Verrucomicrobiota bacterium]
MGKHRPSKRKLILKNAYAAGDIVMLTAAVRDLHLCYPNQFATDVRTPSAELWENNPYLTPLDESGAGVEILDCRADLIQHCNQTPYHYVQAYTEFLNSSLGLRCKPSAFHGDIHLSPLEKSWYSQIHERTGEETPFWIIVAGGKRDVTIKWWSSERYQAVVDYFRGRIQFVQVGETHDHHPPLQGVIDLRGKTDLRQLVRLVYHSQGVLCGVTCLMHLAAAVERKDTGGHDRPCVVVAGGREPPQWETYPAHQFIHNVGMLSCSQGGCWRSRVAPLGDGDERDLPVNLCQDPVGDLPRCMDLISPDEVIARVEGYFRGGALSYLTPEQARVAGAAAVLFNDADPNSQSTASARPAKEVSLISQAGSKGRCAPSGQCRVTLVTLSDDAMTPVASITGKRLRRYADRHDYPLVRYSASLDPSRHPSWSKVLAVRNAMMSRQSPWVMWVDADAVVMDLEFPASRLIEKTRANLVCTEDQNGLNMGVFLIRNCEWSFSLLESVYFLGELREDPDGYKPLWEQSTFKHLIRYFPEVSTHTEVLRQASMNSSLATYRDGDFVLHLSGMSNDDRLAALASLPIQARAPAHESNGRLA